MLSGKAALRVAEWVRVDGVRGRDGGRVVTRVLGASLLLALTWPGAAQAKSPAKQTKPAHLQGAACAAQFARDNAVKPEAGPYRMHITQTLLPNDGTASTREMLIEVVSQQAYRMRGQGANGYLDIVVHGSQSWFKPSEAWVELPSEQNPLMDGPDKQHVDVAGAAVRCLAPGTYQGQAVRSDVAQRKFRDVGRGIGTRTRLLVSASTGLPVFSSVELNMAREPGRPDSGGLMVNEVRHEYDRSIQIPQPEELAP